MTLPEHINQMLHGLPGPSYTTCGPRESTSSPLTSHFASSGHLYGLATQLRRTTDVKRVNRRLHIHDKRKWGTSED